MTARDLCDWCDGVRAHLFLVVGGEVQCVTAEEYLRRPLPEHSTVTFDARRAGTAAEAQRARMEARS